METIQFVLDGGEASYTIVKRIRRAQISQLAKQLHEYDRSEFQLNRRHPVGSCWRHLRDAVQSINYADEA